MLFACFSLCKFAKSLMSFYKPQVSFSLNFASFFNIMKDNCSVLLYLKQYICWSEGVHLKCKFWRLSSAPVKILQIHNVNFKTTSQVLFNFCIILHSTLDKKTPSRFPILTLSSALVKICQILHVILLTTCPFFFNFCITLQCHEK